MKKRFTEEQIIGFLRQAQAGLAGADRVTLDYLQHERGGDWRPMNYLVRLVWTGCSFDGWRAWWLCVAAGTLK
jgi:hypothetical protein